jgi:hypothetical protein
MSTTDTVFEGILQECHVDYVGLWEIVWQLNHVKMEKSKIFEVTMTIIERLLADGIIIAGNFDTRVDDNFHEWQMPVEEIIAKIKHDWMKLGREPTGGDIVWFTAKDSKAS